MKINLYSFKSNYGILFELYKSFKSDNKDIFFLVSCYFKRNDPSIKTYNSFFWFIHRLFFKILKLLGFKYFQVRHFQEIIYDRFYSFQLSESVIIITTNGWIPRTLKKNKELGGINILLAGNPCDLEISKIISREREKTVQISDIYSYEPRLTAYHRSLEFSDKIIIFNQYCYDSFINYVNETKLEYINGIVYLNKETYPEIHFDKNEIFTFCYVGYTILLKGVHVILDAWSKINTSDAQLIIGGTIQEDLKDYLFSKINKFSNVHYVGKIDDLNKFYRQSHVYICSSLIDAGPRTIVEAMYCKLPIIVSENCGNSYLIDNITNGRIYKNNDPTALSKQIEWFLHNKAKNAQMGESAYNRITSELNNNTNFNSAIAEIIVKEKTTF
ncbi:MAG: glycosyltransferase family 4 protein [Bacteroidales bacterium]|nr:glycosyltransferase family 4 protein [Bacteroidales bacterium]